MPEARYFNWIKQAVVGTPGTGVIELGAALPGFRRLKDCGLLLDTGYYINVSIVDGNKRETGVAEYNYDGTTETLVRWTSAVNITPEAIDSGVTIATPLALGAGAIVTCSPIAQTTIERSYGGLFADSELQVIGASTDTYVDFTSDPAIHHNGPATAPTGGAFVEDLVGPTKAMLYASVRFAAVGDATELRAAFHVNSVPVPGGGAVIMRNPSTTGVNIVQLHSAPIILAAGTNVLQLSVFHNDTGSINVGGDDTSHFFGYTLLGV